MTRRKIVGLISITLLIVALATIAFFVIRNITEQPPVTVEQATIQPVAVNDPEAKATLAPNPVTTFTGVDDIHWGKGAVQVVETDAGPTLSFKEDFAVAAGPDLYVYLSPNDAGQELGSFASLGALQSDTGSQTYTLPADYASYKSVIIWCRAFGVTFATAPLS